MHKHGLGCSLCCCQLLPGRFLLVVGAKLPLGIAEAKWGLFLGVLKVKSSLCEYYKTNVEREEKAGVLGRTTRGNDRLAEGSQTMKSERTRRRCSQNITGTPIPFESTKSLVLV